MHRPVARPRGAAGQHLRVHIPVSADARPDYRDLLRASVLQNARALHNACQDQVHPRKRAEADVRLLRVEQPAGSG